MGKGTNGNGLKFDPAEKGLIVIWDKDKQQHRMVRKDNIYEVTFQKVTYTNTYLV